jgi:hypothetical protein
MFMLILNLGRLGSRWARGGERGAAGGREIIKYNHGWGWGVVGAAEIS